MRRRKRGSHNGNIDQTIPVEHNSPTKPIPGSGSKKLPGPKDDSGLGLFKLAVIFIILGAILYGLWRVYKEFRSYFVARKFEAVVHLLNPHPSVGQTLTCSVRFRQNGVYIDHSSESFHDLQQHSKVCVRREDGAHKDIGTVTEVNTGAGCLVGKFSLRKSGTYEVFVKFHKFRVMPRASQPYLITVFPGPPDFKKIDFGTHNPNVICLTQGYERHLKIAVKDEYGNNCKLEDVDLSKFTFELYHMGVSKAPGECEFCLNADTSSLTPTVNDDAPVPIHICLRLKLDEPGVFICAMAYDDYEIPSYQATPKVIVCITPSEETELRRLLMQTLIPGTLLYTCPCEISMPGDDVNNNHGQMFAGISYTNLYFGAYKATLMVYTNHKFPVNPKTKMTFSWSRHTYSDNEKVSILVQDGLRPSLWVEVASETARTLLVCYAHVQGFTLENIGNTFQEKRKVLKHRITPYFPNIAWLNPRKILNVRHGNLVPGSIAAVPKIPEDWLLPFVIKFGDGTTLPVQSWLTSLCDNIFSESEGLFRVLPGSRLYHPVSASVSRHPIDYYKFCGQVLAKCVVEALVRGACTRLSGVKFTKSFLAYMLGYPVDYKYLESDEPNYFRELRTIIASDLTDMDYKFTTLPDEDEPETVNLIPNGSSTPVSNENKEHFLNLLVNHRLIHKVDQEISAIRSGFHSVIDKDTLCDFQKEDLQMLISGGASFDINDLKSNHRLVQEVDMAHVSHSLRRDHCPDFGKLLNWFFVAAQNMSEKEQSYLVFFATGSFSLPSCGFGDLDPKFTINMTGTFNELPKGHPSTNQIILGDCTDFDLFERSLLYAIRPEAERNALPKTTTENRMSLYNPNPSPHQLAIMGPEQSNMALEDRYSSDGLAVQSQEHATPNGNDDGWFTLTTLPTLAQDPFVNWLREMINL